MLTFTLGFVTLYAEEKRSSHIQMILGTQTLGYVGGYITSWLTGDYQTVLLYMSAALIILGILPMLAIPRRYFDLDSLSRSQTP